VSEMDSKSWRAADKATRDADVALSNLRRGLKRTGGRFWWGVGDEFASASNFPFISDSRARGRDKLVQLTLSYLDVFDSAALGIIDAREKNRLNRAQCDFGWNDLKRLGRTCFRSKLGVVFRSEELFPSYAIQSSCPQLVWPLSPQQQPARSSSGKREIIPRCRKIQPRACPKAGPASRFKSFHPKSHCAPVSLLLFHARSD